MGSYLDSTIAYTLYKDETGKPYFVDKTELLEELIPVANQSSGYICITRPRRFGKTVMANMIASFFSRVCDTSDIFDGLRIAASELYRANLNKFPVIHISFNELPRKCKTYEQYIERIEKNLIKDLMQSYPDMQIDETEAVWDILRDINLREPGERFVFVLDEWDYIFHRDFISEQDKMTYLEFLSNLLKGKAYVALAYMTGILPIAKYSSGSELNMFLEYTMASEEKFSDAFGFTDAEVDALYQKYLALCATPKVTREGLQIWYDGYHTRSGERVYNPRSVVASLLNNNLGNYWTSSGPYDEIFYYIEKNVDDVRDDLALMVSGKPVAVKVREYAATAMNLSTRDEIFSAMVVYGFLSYENGYAFIPNKELMDKFCDMLQKEASLGYVYCLARESERMLKATLNRDIATMLDILEYAHNTEVPLLTYNNETELTAIVNLIYLSARDYYRIEREDKSGLGYVDFIFYPEDKSADGIILELKVDSTPEEAIQQIKDKKYVLNFRGKLGEAPKYTGRVLAVGISYDKKLKKHGCKIEEL